MSFSEFDTGYAKPRALSRLTMGNILPSSQRKNILEPPAEAFPTRKSSFLSKKPKSVRFNFASPDPSTDPTYFTATQGQRALLNNVLTPIDLLFQFDHTPNYIENETLDELPSKALLGKGTFGFVESLDLRSLEGSDPSAYLSLLKIDALKTQSGNLPREIARKVFDIKKLLSPEESDSWNAGNDKAVAKALRLELFSELSAMRREMQLHAAVSDSRYIVDFLGWRVHEERDQVVLFLESCHQSLGSVLKAGYKFSVPELAQVAFCLTNALQHVHAEGIAHLDVKPDNLLVGSDGLIKLCDFGVSARFESAPTDLRFTPIYVSPELFFQHLVMQKTDDEETVGEVNNENGDLARLFAKGINGIAKSDVWAMGMCMLDLVFSATPLSYASMNTVRDKLATCIVMSEKGINSSFIDLLLEEGQSLKDEGINMYPGEKDSSPRLKYKTGMIDFLADFETIDHVAERNNVRKLLDFIRKALTVDIEARATCEELLEHQFLSSFDEEFDSVDEGRGNRKEVMHDLLNLLLDNKRRAEGRTYNRKNRASQKLRVLAKSFTSGWLTKFQSMRRKNNIAEDMSQIRQIEKKIGVTL